VFLVRKLMNTVVVKKLYSTETNHHTSSLLHYSFLIHYIRKISYICAVIICCLPFVLTQ